MWFIFNFYVFWGVGYIFILGLVVVVLLLLGGGGVVQVLFSRIRLNPLYFPISKG